jgi:hypothetical protein
MLRMVSGQSSSRIHGACVIRHPQVAAQPGPGTAVGLRALVSRIDSITSLPLASMTATEIVA